MHKWNRAVLLALAVGAIPAVSAQQVTKVLLNVPATNTKYIQQHAIDVGDAPGHQVRVFEIQRTYGADAPMVEGVRIKESWTRGMTDFTSLNGLGIAYNTYILENGDKIYSRGNFIAQAAPSADGKASLRNMSANTITGGTGKFQGIRGVVRADTTADPKSGFNQSKGEMEYWMEK